MPQRSTLTAKPRTTRGKGPARRMRVQGMVPAILYGGEAEATSLAVERREIEHILHTRGGHPIVELKIDGAGAEANEQAMLRHLQRDPVSHQLLHADLVRVRADQQIHVQLELTGLGVPAGVREGGILERPVREIEVRCLPGDMPEHIEVDISQLSINQSIRAGDLPLSEQLHLITDHDVVLFHVVPVRVAAVPEAKPEGEAAEAAEPEVIGAKKEAKEAEA